ncbi:ligase-associated DNA damage response DEXH box helicase [Mucilaginibacter phyllosphaerae]|uniref:ATP-dependent Lhr-like helicase n=1 Tax=Mucilaginibacter phyllosphaerae TaxID=1812349 RepID=A0A4Y8ADP9_9SPHI|nr:ligase-associated DNA damage response DEXH box helicase [Mucilaginibacter phyllosphaerae]MBB3970361.1 ATP-dependent Lhr-like helicase [Mucilaginibacter phyllosphaerae]TEW66730.1 ligase-associated DNA damage response DEXH box helicase [Mucilaginibacter phyllosphaerae]GGH11513.1 DNA ligase-associated DEXH box helicase [Mucilaginibacter phyllosphaerae]
MASKGQKVVQEWYKQKQWKQFPFQKEMEAAYLSGFSGLLNAPTGSGKTFALFLPFLADFINKYPDTYTTQKNNGLLMLWITPLRALTNDIRKAMQEVCDDMGLPWRIMTRTGDTSAADKAALKRKLPEVLLTTPESLHLMLAQKEYDKVFKGLQVLVCDEWHELLGTKRGVQVELGLSRLKGLGGPDMPAGANLRSPVSNLRIWGISATIGNLEQAAEVLLGNDFPPEQIRMVRAQVDKKLVIESVIPENIENYSWAGHIGVKLLPQVMDIVAKSKTTLIFTNTRSQSEIWYHAIIDNYPEYAGIMAMHHGSLDNELRNWVEQALHAEALKVVVCTSSLDLGVDFRPVDTVVQVGSPKGVARFMQRAGRSGHHPGAISKAYFVPTHSLELLEGAALKSAIKKGVFESRDPMLLTFDVLIQFMVTLAVSDGFRADELYHEIKSTFAFADLRRDEFNQLLDFITNGGKTLAQYDEFLKVEVDNGLFKVNSRRVAMRHRLSIGTITSELSIRVKWLSGGSLGTLEEGFIAKLKPGDTFWFAGRSLEFIKVKEMTAFVKKSTKVKGLIPSWAGGRMPLSSQLSAVFRDKLDEVAHGIETDVEVKALKPLFALQAKLSHLPQSNEFLIESFKSREGHHLLFYPFEGRLVHEGMASLLAYRISKIKPASFSIAMNDYGFELLTDEDIPIEEALEDADFFSLNNLIDDIQNSLNSNEMARRRFRDIAHIGGLVFTGYPGQPVKNKHLQASTSLLFDVFNEYEPDNILVRQAYNEALALQLEEFRLRAALQRIQTQSIVLKTIERPTPFAFPILVDSLGRERLTTETMEERIAKMARRYGADEDADKPSPRSRKPGIVRKKGF